MDSITKVQPIIKDVADFINDSINEERIITLSYECTGFLGMVSATVYDCYIRNNTIFIGCEEGFFTIKIENIVDICIEKSLQECTINMQGVVITIN
jgi:hypothetical protein